MAMHGSRMSEFISSPPLESDAAEQGNLLPQDIVRIQEDGLVYPGPEGNDPVCNGAMLMPHATFLLEISQNYYDCYEEQKAAGRNVPEPYFFTVPKGLRMPNTLLLAYEDGEMFHLMPRAGMPLSALNRELNSLFSSSACSRLPYREWFKKYNFLKAFNKGEDEWMAE
ncbi:hypothetical protein diail_8715 [Diaporthe ilicicola]|nr:hypothetical protein diail_8715 [Diaporthe ilicicola]